MRLFVKPSYKLFQRNNTFRNSGIEWALEIVIDQHQWVVATWGHKPSEVETNRIKLICAQTAAAISAALTSTQVVLTGESHEEE